jgi:carbon storage regulator
VLLLTRRENESIVIGDGIEVKVLEIGGGRVRLGVTAPRQIPVHRREIHEAITAQNKAAAQTSPADLDAVLRPQ